MLFADNAHVCMVQKQLKTFQQNTVMKDIKFSIKFDKGALELFEKGPFLYTIVSFRPPLQLNFLDSFFTEVC